MRLETATPDILDLISYYHGAEGRKMAKVLANAVEQLWPRKASNQLLCLGYGEPVLRCIADRPKNIVQAMPLNQGIESEETTYNRLVSPDNMPFMNEQFTLVFMIHWLEFCPSPAIALEEVWRITARGGDVICIVPHALSCRLWRETCPFNKGRAWHRYGLEKYLNLSGFKSIATKGAYPLWDKAFLPSKLLVHSAEKTTMAPAMTDVHASRLSRISFT